VAQATDLVPIEAAPTIEPTRGHPLTDLFWTAPSSRAAI
jgi:hypothetical protein